jgi:hypothetical protein
VISSASLNIVGLVLNAAGFCLLVYDLLFKFELSLPQWQPKRMSEVDDGQTVLARRRVPTYSEDALRGLRWRSRGGAAMVLAGILFQILSAL